MKDASLIEFSSPVKKDVFVPRDYQEKGIEIGVNFLNSERGHNAIQVLPTGCHAKGTEVIMYDLSVKPVEDVVVGDVLMGPDSSPRKVLQLCRGNEEMYRVTPRKGVPFVVNKGHVLNLVSTCERGVGKAMFPSTRRGGEVEFISVEDYLSKSKSWKHLRKLQYCDVIGKNIREELLPIEPWYLGIMLGDGCLLYNRVSVCSPDVEIEKGVYELAKQFDCFVSEQVKVNNNKAKSYYIVKREGKGKNPLLNALKLLGVKGKSAAYKEIPEMYVRSSPRVRAEILAGLIDTDGHYDKKGGYDFISKSKKMAEQVVFIAKSLGINACINECKKGCQNGFVGTYHRVHLSGYTDRVPCRVARKVADKRRINKDPSRTGFDIEPIGSGDFYGFTLDGDHLYMTTDFMIHHNSGKSVLIANICKRVDHPILVLQPSKEILKQNYAKYVSYGGSAGIFSASVGRKDLGHVTFASIQSVMSRNSKGKYYSAHLFKHFRHIIVDEVHLGSSAKGSQLLDFIEMVKEHSGKMPRVLGFTATPFRLYPCSDRYGNKDSMLKMLTRTRPRIFGEINYHVQVSELLERGYLAKCRYFDVRSQLSQGFDRSGLKVNSTGADYDEKALQKYYDTINFKEDIVDLVNRITATGRQVLVFMSSVSDALWVSERLLDSATVHATTPKSDCDRTEERFKKGTLRSVINCGKWTVGYDQPSLKTVLIARPVRSLAWYYQAFGRAIRPHNDEDAWLIDACGNLGVFGRIEDLKIDSDVRGLPILTGSNGKLLTGVPLKEQETYVGEQLKTRR